MEEVKYPVKYALMPVKTYRTNKMGEEYITDICYLISKAYVIEEHRKYQEDGTYSVKYQICFPYKVYTEGISPIKTTPSKNAHNSNETLAFNLFDSYEEALIAKEQKNAFTPDEVVEQFQQYEDKIQELTKDMVIDSEKEDFDKKIRDIQAYILKERGIEPSYEEALLFLCGSMILDTLWNDYLIEECNTDEVKNLLSIYLDNRSMEEICDYLDYMTILEPQNNTSKVKKKN